MKISSPKKEVLELCDKSTSLLGDDTHNDYNEVKHCSFKGLISWLVRTLIPKTLYSDEMDQRIHSAAFLIRDAVAADIGNPTEGAYLPYEHPEAKNINSIAVFCGRICHHRSFFRILHVIVWLLSLVTLIEPPHWCREGPTTYYQDYNNELTPTENCALLMGMTGPAASLNDGDNDDDSSAIVEYYPNANSVLISVEQSAILEWIFISIVALFILLQIGRDGCSCKRYLRTGRAQYARMIQIICISFLALALVLHKAKFNPFLRLLLLGTYIESLQRECKSMASMFSDIMRIFVFYFLVVAFYAGFGTVAFYQTEQGAAGFENFLESLWTLWICITTANYPDIMMPSYNQNRLTALYFISFMIISFFFFLNLITSRISNTYGKIESARKEEQKAYMELKLKSAFDVMDFDNKGEIEKETILNLFAVLNKDFPSVEKLDHTDLTFLRLDEDNSGSIDLDEFTRLKQALLYKFVKTSEYESAIKTYFPVLTNTSCFQGLRRTISSKWFDYVIDTVLLLNGICIIVQAYPMLAGEYIEMNDSSSNGEIDTWWEIIETIFTLIYVLEMILKISVWGWKKYFENQRNVFDFTVTMSAVVAFVYVYYPNTQNDSSFLRVLVGLRMFRLIRLLTARKEFRDLGVIITRILPKLYHFFIVYYFLIYFFSVMGVVLYGGMINRNPNDDLAYLVLDTDFSNNEYWANNFNDAISGMNVIFNLLVINNWTISLEGYEAVTEGKQVRWFFFAFHMLGIIFVNNVILSWFIDNVNEQVQELEGQKREMEDKTEIVEHSGGASRESYYARMESTIV